MASIFTSYARSDAARVLGHAQEIRAAGLRLWVDQLDIETGKRWDREVEAALRACEVVLLFLSPASVASDNVLDEVSFAIDHGKPIVPVLIEPCEAPLRLRRLQHIDLTRGASLQLVIDKLRERSGASAQSPAPEIATPPRRSFAEALKAHSADISPVLGAKGMIWTFGVWNITSSGEPSVPDLYFWTNSGETALELIGVSNGWWRLRRNGAAYIVWSGEGEPELQEFDTQPWKDVAPSWLRLPLARGQLTLSQEGYSTTIDIADGEACICMHDGAVLTLRADSTRIELTSPSGVRRAY